MGFIAMTTVYFHKHIHVAVIKNALDGKIELNMSTFNHLSDITHTLFPVHTALKVPGSTPKLTRVKCVFLKYLNIFASIFHLV